MTVSCPTCRKPTPWEDNPYRPFCSDRCRGVDLSKWFDESYRIPMQDDESENEPTPLH